MSDAAAWCLAVFLMSLGLAAEFYLARSFIQVWRLERSEQRARRRRVSLPASAPTSAGSPLLVCTTLATIGLTTNVATAQAITAPDSAQPPAAEQPQTTPPTHPTPLPADRSVSSALRVQLNLDFTNAYFYRGIRQQDRGLIVQPAARLTSSFIDADEFTLAAFIGTWNSFGPNTGTQSGPLIEGWYESDLYAGVTATYGKLALTTSYTFLTSPSDAFQTVEELGFTLALDDSSWLHSRALNPYATLVFETGANGSDGAALDDGVYLELGVAPGFSFILSASPLTLTFPASVGLSLSDYYQDAAGNDDPFGFAQLGAKASLPLRTPGRLGAWTLNAGVSVLLLGDHTQDFNRGDEAEVIGTLGLQWNF